MNTLIPLLNRLGADFMAFAWPMLWQSSVLIAAVFAVDILFARKIRASVRHALWLVALMKLLLPPGLALPTGVAWWLFPAKAVVQSPAEVRYSVAIRDFSSSWLVTQETNPVAAPPPSPALTVAGGILLTGALVSAGLLSWLLLRWWQLARQVRNAVTPLHLQTALDAARRQAGLRGSVVLKLVDGALSPSVCGLFQPVILLPRLLPEQLSGSQLHVVLLHEAIHLRRRDIWVNCAQALLQIVFWWHPPLWVANARIRRVREEAVDDAVMVALRDQADTYAPTLLQVAKMAVRRPILSPGLIGIMEPRSALRQRVERLLEFQAPRHPGVTFASLCGILAFSAVALPMGQVPAPAGRPMVTNEVSSPAPNTSPGLPAHVQPQVLIQAEIYCLPVGEFNALVASLPLHPGNQDERPWWSASANDLARLHDAIEKSGYPAVQRPHVKMNNGMRADFYVGDGTNGIQLDWTPFVSGQIVRLAFHGTSIDRHGTALTTNQFHASASVYNYGGLVTRFENAGASSNLVCVTQVQILTNGPAKRAAIDTSHPRVNILADTNYQNDRRALDHPYGGIAGADIPAGAASLVYDGKLLYEQNQLHEAKEKFKAALALNPWDTTAQYFLDQITAELARRNQPQIRVFSPGSLALDRIRITSVRFDHLPLEQVVRQLNDLARANDPEKAGFPVLIAANSLSNLSSIIINIPLLVNVRFTDLLDAITLVANPPVKYSFADSSVVFSGRAPPEMLFSRTFRVPLSIFPGVSTTLEGALTNSPSKLIRDFFCSLGVDWDWPPGKTVFYQDWLGYLFVRATESDLDLIEHALGKLNLPSVGAPPQVHVKAWFYEASKGTAAGLGEFLISTNSGDEPIFTGILAGQSIKNALLRLKSRNAWMLGEPEATVLSGRQVEMRSMHLVTAVTNLTFTQANSNSLETTTVEVGPVLDAVPYVLADGFTINLALVPGDTEFRGDQPSLPLNLTGGANGSPLPQVFPKFTKHGLAATYNVWDGQIVVMARPFAVEDKELLILVIGTVVDAAGNRVHTDQDMEFAKTHVPWQPTSAATARPPYK